MTPGNQQTGKFFCQSSHTVITETIVTKKFTTDEEGAGPLLPNLLIEKLPEVERRRLYVLVCGY